MCKTDDEMNYFVVKFLILRKFEVFEVLIAVLCVNLYLMCIYTILW
jgi:hypothetical protein